jgi:choline dehydrogenase-like flavoprotein
MATGSGYLPYGVSRDSFSQQEIEQLKLLTGRIICLPSLFPAGKRLPKPKTHYSSIICILMKPTSRGSVHIQSPNSSVQPSIDPAYLGSPSELEILKLGIRKVLQISETEQWKKVMARSLLKDDLEQITRKDNPGLDEDGAMEYFCRERAATTFHFVGSAAMLPRENGGVVDSRLKVYGTTNLRVVSIMPPSRQNARLTSFRG